MVYDWFSPSFLLSILPLVVTLASPLRPLWMSSKSWTQRTVITTTITKRWKSMYWRHCWKVSLLSYGFSLFHISYHSIVSSSCSSKYCIGSNIGVMRNDEPIAPLRVLLSPQYLGSDRASKLQSIAGNQLINDTNHLSASFQRNFRVCNPCVIAVDQIWFYY